VPSFDVVSEVDLQEVRNAVDQASRELATRFDFKGTDSTVELKDDAIELESASEERLKAVTQVLEEKLVKRKVSLKAIDYGKVEEAAKGRARQKVALQVGINDEKAREIGKFIKGLGLKGVQHQVQGDQLRVNGKKRDDLQTAIQKVLSGELEKMGFQLDKVNLGASHLRQPVIPAGRHDGQRVDQRRRLPGTPQGEQSLGCVSSQCGRRIPGFQARLPGGFESARRYLGGALELRQLEQRVAFVGGQPHQGRGVAGGTGGRPPSLQGGEPVVDLPAHEGLVGERRHGAGDQRRGAGRFGCLKRLVQHGEVGRKPLLDVLHEEGGVVEQGVGVIVGGRSQSEQP